MRAFRAAEAIGDAIAQMSDSSSVYSIRAPSGEKDNEKVKKARQDDVETWRGATAGRDD